MHIKVIAFSRGMFDNTVAFLDVPFGKLPEVGELPKTRSRTFGMAGGAINTNSGLRFTKAELLQIAEAMPEGSEFSVAGCNRLDVEALVHPEFK